MSESWVCSQRKGNSKEKLSGFFDCEQGNIGTVTHMIAIIDYGMGNLRSVQKAFETVGHEAEVTRAASVIHSASHVVLPGVGAFPDCMHNLEQYGLIDPIKKVIQQGKPFLGICLGFQLLFTESEEFGTHKGLDILPGRVVPFSFQTAGLTSSEGKQPLKYKVPHMGWNVLRQKTKAPPLKGLEQDAYVYFVHSYCVQPKEASDISTETDYGDRFVSAVWRDNVFGCQFHPEKSQKVGLNIIRNFGDWQA